MSGTALPLARRLPGRRAAGLGAAAGVVLLVLGFTWAALTEVEIVTTARAAARVSAGTRVVRAPVARTVASLPVAEGRRVARGQPVARLESTLADAEWRSARRVLTVRRRALADHEAVRRVLDGASEGVSRAVRLRVDAQRSRLAQLDGELELLRTELEIAGQRVNVAVRLRDLAEQRDRALQRARDLGAIGRLEALGSRQAFWSQGAEVEAARGRVATLEQRLQARREARRTADLEFRERLDSEIVALRVEIAEREARLADAAHDRRQTTIVAPVAGVLDRLPVTVGGFVERGEPLAVIVPSEDAVYFEARVAAAQSGFLHPGMPCRIKLDALPFPRFGSLPCTLTRLGSDAVTDETGSHYLARVEPAAQSLWADGAVVPLQPGATAWVDIVSGRRSVLGYVTEPLTRFARESLRER